MIISVPYRRQQTKYSCGPAALQMVLEYFGSTCQQRVLAKQMRAQPVIGTSTAHMVRAAARRGFCCYVNDRSSLDDIRYFLTKKLPPIVRFVEPTTEDDHYAVVSGINNRSIILNDPWNGENFRITHKEFIRRWHSEDHSHVAWLMVLAREDFELGEQYPRAQRRAKLRTRAVARAAGRATSAIL
ncbi:MAG TPA: cysteine peptidase family C39 domain-containing protein [Candidatus Paceibacterota bacterium]|nr:cysteine peptidase family C39 domain-containing protein [Candidatus Paceibacterota bacterium]